LCANLVRYRKRTQKQAAEKAKCHRRGTVKAAEKALVKNESENQEFHYYSKRKEENSRNKNRLLRQSNQNSLIPSESWINETKGLLKE
jgi:hypothetical protein